MSDTGWVSPGTVVTTGESGEDWIWTTPENAKVSDNTYANYDDTDEYTSEYLKASNFGFSIPSGATINGIEVRIERKAARDDTWYVEDNDVRLIKANGTLGSENKADTTVKWPTSDSYKTYGGDTDLWSDSWSDSDINDIDFGLSLQVYKKWSEVYVDHIQIKVYYTESSTPTVGVKYPLPAFKRL